MKNALPLLTIAVFSLSVLLAGCGNSEQAGSEPESSSSVRVETSLETVSPAEPETSESQPDVIVSEPLQQPASSVESESQTTDRETMAEEISAMNMMVQVGGSTFTATLEENTAVDALVEMMEQEPVTIQMSDYSGFEKVGPLEQAFPPATNRLPHRPGTSCCIRAIKLSCSTALISGAIPGWATSTILLAGKKLWAAAM